MNKKEKERLFFCILVQKQAFSGTDFLRVQIETVLEGSSFHPRGNRAFCACAFAQLERKEHTIYPISSKLFEMICTMQTFSFTIISN